MPPLRAWEFGLIEEGAARSFLFKGSREVQAMGEPVSARFRLSSYKL
jgi:hypothetical protein